MAKKVAKKTANKSATKKVAKKAGKASPAKPAGKSTKKASKKTTKKAARKPAGGMVPARISSGKGMTTHEIGTRLIEMVNARAPEHEIWQQLFHPRFESIEGDGHMWTGVKAVAKKGEEWMSKNTVHSFSAEGPYVGATGFGVRFTMDVESKETGQRMNFDEVGIYTVKNGKVVREEFMYNMSRGM